MPTVLFDIPNPLSNTIILNASRKGSVQFTVNNISGRPLARVAAKLTPMPDATAAYGKWLKLDPEGFRDFKISDSLQYSATIDVPATGAAGNYIFRLDVWDDANPDDTLIGGPSITFTVPAPLPPPKIPWWVWVVLGALIVVIVGAILILKPGPAPAPAPTTTPTALATVTAAPTQAPTPTPVPTPSPLPTVAIVPEDCLPYTPGNLTIVNEGANGWVLTNGSSSMLIMDNQADAIDALAMAKRYTAQCFIGRDNTRSNRSDYIVPYWRGNSGLTTSIIQNDCIGYNKAGLNIVNEGASGWLLTDGASRMLILNNQQDAQNALILAKRYTKQCFIGRGNTRANRKDYIIQYWQ